MTICFGNVARSGAHIFDAPNVRSAISTAKHVEVESILAAVNICTVKVGLDNY